jgi:predicted enzyme related to lactoylglutathione lyase
MNHFCHIELPSKNLKKAKAFYETVFGWKISTWEGSANYLMFETPEGVGGAFTTEFKLAKTAGILLYIHVESIPKCLTKIIKAGGKTIKPKTKITKIGFYAIFTDAEGNQLGLFANK